MKGRFKRTLAFAMSAAMAASLLGAGIPAWAEGTKTVISSIDTSGYKDIEYSLGTAPSKDEIITKLGSTMKATVEVQTVANNDEEETQGTPIEYYGLDDEEKAVDEQTESGEVKNSSDEVKEAAKPSTQNESGESDEVDTYKEDVDAEPTVQTTESMNVPVTWSCINYNQNQEGTYTFTASIDTDLYDATKVTLPSVKVEITQAKSFLDVVNEKGDSIDGKYVQVGEIITYKIKAVNPVLSTKQATTTLDIPNGMGFESANNGGTYNSDTNVVTWKSEVTTGAVKEYTLKVKVKSVAEGSSLSTQAVEKIGSETLISDTKSVTVMNKPVTEVTNIKNVDIEEGFAREGDTIVYITTWKNGTGKEQKVKMTADIPSAITITSSDPKAAISGDTATWSGTVPAGESFAVVTKAVVNDLDGASAVISYAPTVEVEGLSMKATAVKNYVAGLTVSAVGSKNKSLNGALVSLGGEVTYNIHVENPSKSSIEIELDDIFPDNTEFVSASDKSFYVVSSEEDEIGWEYTLSGEDEKDFTVTLKLLKAGKEYANAAILSVGNVEYESNEVKNWVPADVKKVVYNENDEEIEDKVFALSSNAMDLTYKITVKNPAETEKKFTVTDTLLTEMTFVSASNEGTYSNDTNAVVWELMLAAGEEKTISATVSVPGNTSLSKVVNTAAVSADGYEGITNESIVYVTSNPTMNATTQKSSTSSSSSSKTSSSSSSSKTTTTSGKSLNNGYVLGGDTYTYTITWSNPTDKARTYDVTDVLPDGVTFDSASDNGSEDGGTVTWSRISVGANATKTLTVSVTVDKKTSDKKLYNTAHIELTNDATHYSEDTNSVMVYAGTFNKTVRTDKDGDNKYNDLVSDGESFYYDIYVKNESGKNQTVTITDSIDSKLTVVEATEDGSVSGQTVTWSNVTIPNGGQHLYIKVTVKAGTQTAEVNNALISNTAKMTTSVAGGSATSNPVKVYVLPKATKKAEITAAGKDSKSTVGTSSDSSLSVQPGDTVKYTIHQSNPSGDARYFTITDTVDANLVIGSVENGGKANGQTVTWKVLISAGGAVDVAFSVTVPATDKELNINNAASVVSCNSNATESNTVILKVTTLEKTEDSAAASSTDNSGADTINDTETGASGTTNGKVKNRATGDDANMILWISLAAAAAAGIGVVIYKKKKSA